MDVSKLKFLIDNNLSPQLALELRNRGFDAVHVRDINMSAADDLQILQHAAREDRVVISLDSDFSTILVGLQHYRPSVIHVRTHRKSQAHILPLLVANLPPVEFDLQSGAIVVVDDSRIRVRRLPIIRP